jgi:hypothetical protein
MGSITSPIDQLARKGDTEAYLMAAVKILRGSAVFMNSSGYATGTFSSGQPFLGIAEQTVDNSAGGSGTDSSGNPIYVVVRRTGIIQSVTIASAAITDLGKTVYWADNNTVTEAVAIDRAGTIVKYNSSTSVDIAIAPCTISGPQMSTPVTTNVTTNGTQYSVPVIDPVTGAVLYVTAKSAR